LAEIAAGLVIGAAIWFYVIECGVPVRGALRIEPTEALRHDG